MATQTIDLKRGAYAKFSALRGDTTEMSVVFKDSTGAVIDLSGSTPKMQIKDSTKTTLVYEPVCAFTGSTLTIDFANCPINQGFYKYDLQLTYLGEVITVMYGDIEIVNDVTT